MALLEVARELGIRYRVVVSKLEQVLKHKELLADADEVVYKNGYHYSQKIQGYQKLIVDSCDTVLMFRGSEGTEQALQYSIKQEKKIEEIVLNSTTVSWCTVKDFIGDLCVEFALRTGGEQTYDIWGYKSSIKGGLRLRNHTLDSPLLREVIKYLISTPRYRHFMEYSPNSLENSPKYAKELWSIIQKVGKEELHPQN